MSSGRQAESRFVQRFQQAAASASLLLCLSLAILYAARPDAFAAVTVWPVWVWLAPGCALTALGFQRGRKRMALLLSAAWLTFLFIHAEEPRSLLRFHAPGSPEWIEARKAGRALRVVSLNCGGGSPQAAGEVAAFDPDIVLLQESPVRKDVEALARRLYGHLKGCLWGMDGSLIARGKAIPASLPPQLSMSSVQAWVRLDSGIEAEVFSLRLIPPVFREDLWSPACWRAHRENRLARRAQLRPFADRVRALPPDTPVIFGGDLNAPAGDSVFRLLAPRLRDSFSEAGAGWGNTIMNEIPVLRIDQVWISRRFLATTVVARKTIYSDHRMVICDLLLR